MKFLILAAALFAIAAASDDDYQLCLADGATNTLGHDVLRDFQQLISNPRVKAMLGRLVSELVKYQIL